MTHMKINELTPYSKDINLKFMIIKKHSTIKTKDESIVNTYLISDESGSIEYSVFDQELRIGDIIVADHAYVTFFKGKLRLFNSEITEIRRIGEFTMDFCIAPNLSETVKQ